MALQRQTVAALRRSYAALHRQDLLTPASTLFNDCSDAVLSRETDIWLHTIQQSPLSLAAGRLFSIETLHGLRHRNGESTSYIPAAGYRTDCFADEQRCLLTSSHALQFGRNAHAMTDPDGDIFVYEGPLSKAVKNLKRLSLAGCVVSVVGGPILVFGAAEGMPLAAQGSLIATIAAFGLFTTSLLHWFTAPYVHRLEFERGSGNARLETVSILGRPRWTAVHSSEARYPDTIRPQVTFEAQGRFFYLDADHFRDKGILASLTPEDPAAQAAGDKSLNESART